MEQRERMTSFGQKWTATRPRKTAVFWALLAAVVVTMIIGFTWGGWVTGGTARQMAATSAEDAVVSRLTPMCVLQAKQDPKQTEKFKEFKEVSAWQQGDYVKKQGWATMPGEKEPEGKIADACARVLNQ